MGRPLAHRRDYARDAQSLQRIVMAVQSDETRPQEWRREQVDKLTEVIYAFNRDAVRDRPAVEDLVAQAVQLIDAPRSKRKTSR